MLLLVLLLTLYNTFYVILFMLTFYWYLLYTLILLMTGFYAKLFVRKDEKRPCSQSVTSLYPGYPKCLGRLVMIVPQWNQLTLWYIIVRPWKPVQGLLRGAWRDSWCALCNTKTYSWHQSQHLGYGKLTPFTNIFTWMSQYSPMYIWLPPNNPVAKTKIYSEMYGNMKIINHFFI